MALAINKIDRVPAERLLGLSAEMNAAREFAATFMISAERGHGVEDLRRWLAGQVPEGPWLYPEDQIADLPLRLIAAETTREKLTLRLHQELPYELTVETEGWEERKDGSVRIDQVVYVARDGHKGIALGPKGETIKAVGQAAREEIKAFLGREVHLFLTVKVRPNWLEERERYGEMGLDFSDGEAMSGPRLTAEFWVQAYLARLRLRDIPAFVTARGDATAGAVVVKLDTLDGRGAGVCAQLRRDGRAGLDAAGGGGGGGGGRGADAAAAVRSGPLGDRGRGPAGAAPARPAGAGGLGSGQHGLARRGHPDLGAAAWRKLCDH